MQPAPPSVTRPAPRTVADHVRRTLELAIPVTFGRLGILVLVAVDMAMTGHYQAQDLAWYSIALAPQVPMILVGIGLLMGTVILTARADGEEDHAQCGRVWRAGLLHAAAYGALLAGLCHAGEAFLAATGQQPSLAAGGGRVLVVLGWGLAPMFLFTATTFFLEGISRPIPGTVVMVLANLVNAALNWVFIFGHLGLPAMGAEGAALATTATRWFMFAAVAGYALLRLDRRRLGITGEFPGAAALGRDFRRLGYPVAIAYGLESGAFSTMTLFAGLLGPAVVAGYQVAMNLVALVFMCAIGFSTAASVRVANAVGRRDPRGLRLAGWVASALAAGAIVCIAIVFAAFPGSLASLYTRDAAVLAVAVPAVWFAALLLVPDGSQAVLMGALRGLADVWPATGLYLIAFVVIMVPTGYWLGIATGGGATGLMQAVIVGTVCATAFAGLRFHVVSRRMAGGT